PATTITPHLPSLHDALPILPPMVSPRSKEGDYKAVSESLRYLDKVAEETGTVIYLEPLNRYQDHMINLLADARHYIDSNQLKHVDRKSTRLNSSHVSISYAV